MIFRPFRDALLGAGAAAALCAWGAAAPAASEATPPARVVPLRVHLGESGREKDAFGDVFAEINRIWWSQARICFDIEAVLHDEPLRGGMDLWFVDGLEGYNGYFAGRHEIRVRDFPDLAPAADPAADAAARTAAHELGHGLGLGHRQDSDDNLMRSKTYGWRLDAGEVARARRSAGPLSRGGASPPPCPASAEGAAEDHSPGAPERFILR